MSILTSEAVTETFNAVQDDDGNIEVDLALGGPTRFNSKALEGSKERIRELLLELPEGFIKSGSGGGWSFLEAANDKHGNQWTGMHMVMAQLFGMGQAAGLVESLLPRELWAVAPGGMPYYVVIDT
jgi:hypothetical protein